MQQQMQSRPTEIEKLIDISDSIDDKTGQKFYLIQIFLSKQMLEKMDRMIESKKEKIRILKQRQRDQQFIKRYKRSEQIKRSERREEEMKKQENMRLMKEIEIHSLERQRFSFSAFESFQNRGKYKQVKYSYDSVKKVLQIKINKNYLINELKSSEKDLFNIAIYFIHYWEKNFTDLVKRLIQLYSQKSHYQMYIRSIDLISLTFDVQYPESKVFRFRYSPFEFKHNIMILEENNVNNFEKIHSKYFQYLSCITEVIHATKTIVDQDFYTAPRLPILEDLSVDSNCFVKIVKRFYFFYQVFNVSKGNIGIVQQQFCKKACFNYYFNFQRLKKFSFTWNIKAHRKSEITKKNEKQELKEELDLQLIALFNIQSGKQEGYFRVRTSLIENNKLIPIAFKEQMAQKICEWYNEYKVSTLSNDYLNMWHSSSDKLALKNLKGKFYQMSPNGEQIQFQLRFFPKEKVEKFFIGFLVMITNFLDRSSFINQQKNYRRESVKKIELETRQIQTKNPKKQYQIHHHCYKVILKHTLFNLKDPKQNSMFLKGNQSHHYYRLKFGEWRFQKLIKTKRKINIKNEKEFYQKDEKEIQIYPNIYATYINSLLKNFPLFEIHRQIVNFIEVSTKASFTIFEDRNSVQITKNSSIIESVFRLLMKYCNKDYLEKNYEKEREKMIERQKKDKEDYFQEMLMFTILKEGDFGFINEDLLISEITFKLIQFKSVWITKINYGTIIVRVFTNRVDLQIENKTHTSIPIVQQPNNIPPDYNKPNFDEVFTTSIDKIIKEIKLLQLLG